MMRSCDIATRSLPLPVLTSAPALELLRHRFVRARRRRAAVVVAANYSAFVHEEGTLTGLAVFFGCGDDFELIANYRQLKLVSVFIEQVGRQELLRSQVGYGAITALPG